jgi:hypothetical protein
MKTRHRPNYQINRYNQHVIAGKIAVSLAASGKGGINPYDGKGNIHEIYRTNDNTLHYAVIGQDFLRKLGIKVQEI